MSLTGRVLNERAFFRLRISRIPLKISGTVGQAGRCRLERFNLQGWWR
jgi:hypothetical protein